MTRIKGIFLYIAKDNDAPRNEVPFKTKCRKEFMGYVGIKTAYMLDSLFAGERWENSYGHFSVEKHYIPKMISKGPVGDRGNNLLGTGKK